MNTLWFLNFFFSGNNSIIVIRRLQWRQFKGKVGKVRNIYSKLFYGSYLRNYYEDLFISLKLFKRFVYSLKINCSTDKGKQDYIVEENHLSEKV